MAKEDVEAGKAYLGNWDSFTRIQKLHFLRNHSPDAEVRQRLNILFAEAKTEAMQQMLVEAAWHDRFIQPHLDAMKKCRNNDGWTADEEEEGRRLITSGNVTTGARLQELLSMNRTIAQSLFRHITGKKKKRHRTD